MSPHGRLRERAIFTADIDRDRATRKPGEPPPLRREARDEERHVQGRHPINVWKGTMLDV